MSLLEPAVLAGFTTVVTALSPIPTSQAGRVQGQGKNSDLLNLVAFRRTWHRGFQATRRAHGASSMIKGNMFGSHVMARVLRRSAAICVLLLLPLSGAAVGASEIKPSDRAKAMKRAAASVVPQDYGSVKTGAARVQNDKIVVPLMISESEELKEGVVDNFMSIFLTGFCSINTLTMLAKFDITYQFDVSQGATQITSRVVTPQDCGDTFAKASGFGSVLTVTPLSGREDLPAFSFKNLIAGIALSPTVLSECDMLSTRPNGIVHCYYGPLDVSGATAYTSADFYRGGLAALEMKVFTYDSATVLSAFKEKYGPPCETEVLLWQNTLGARFDNPSYTWCFSTGNLKFTAIGEKIDESVVSYTDANLPISKKPVVNF